MIAIHIQTWFILYLTLMLILLVAVASYERWNEYANGWHISEETLCQCPECHYAFVVRRKETVSRCPRCNRLCHVQTKNRRH